MLPISYGPSGERQFFVLVVSPVVRLLRYKQCYLPHSWDADENVPEERTHNDLKILIFRNRFNIQPLEELCAVSTGLI